MFVGQGWLSSLRLYKAREPLRVWTSFTLGVKATALGWAYMLSMAAKTKIAQRRMIVIATAQWPMKFAVAFFDRGVVNTGDAQTHQPRLVEFPIFIAIAPKPVSGVVMSFICKAHSNAILAESPKLLNQAVVKFAIPLSR
jgi:hypothetical protein